MLSTGSPTQDARLFHVPHEMCKKLEETLLYEQNAIGNAYDSLLTILHHKSGGDDTLLHASHVLRGLTALLRFIFERLYQHMAQAALKFAHESGASKSSKCRESITALHSTLTVLSRVHGPRTAVGPECSIVPDEEKTRFKPARHVFAISSFYDWETQCDIVKLVTRGLNRTAVILPKSEIDIESTVALQFGCNFLVSPKPPASVIPACVTREQLLQYFAHIRPGGLTGSATTQTAANAKDDVDDELDEMLHRLDGAARSSSLLVGAFELANSARHTAVVPRNALRGDDSTTDEQVSTIGSLDIITRHNSLGESRELCSSVTRRPRLESSVVSLLPSEPTSYSDELSQVIQYRHDSPPRTVAETVDVTEDFTSKPENWIFQISNSLKGLKSEIIAAIRGLGCRVDNRSAYNTKTTHLVVAEGVTERTEKYMSFCAALKYIVPPRYVFDSAKRGRWIVGRLREYDRNPLRHHWSVRFKLPFTGWRVTLFTSSYVVQSGILAVLQAGGCAHITSYVFDNASDPVVDYEAINASSHLLVECRDLSPSGRFCLPLWFPTTLKRRDPRFFSLELLHHILCFCTTPLFDDMGRLVDGQTLPLSCTLELSDIP